MHDWASEVRSRLGQIGYSPGSEAYVVEEIVHHLEDRYAELRAAGVDHETAVAETLEELADEEVLSGRLRGTARRFRERRVPVGVVGGGDVLEVLWTDLRYGLRLAMHRPLYTVVVVLTLALGIGATTAIFSVVDAILLREPPFPEMDELVVVWETDRDSETRHEPASWPDLVDFRERSRTLAAIGGMIGIESILVREDADPERLHGLGVTANVPALLGVRPLLGTLFDEAQVANGAPLVLLGESMWRSRLGADPGIVGSTIHLNGELMSVVGVLPADAALGISQVHARADYSGPFNGRDVDVWIGIAPDEARFPRQTHPFIAIGRMADGVSLEEAQTELSSIAADLERAHQENAARGVNLEPLNEVIFGPTRPTLMVLLGAVGLVLLITCANVANLMMARATTRRRELAVRAALGARGRRMATQLLMETLVLTSLGAAAGLAIAYGGVRTMVALAPAGIPRIEHSSIDWRVLVVTGAVTLTLTLILGLLPTRRAWGTDLRGQLQAAGGARNGEGAARRTRAALTVSQTALAVALVIVAGILLRSFSVLTSVDPGFQTEQIIKAEYQLPAASYPLDFQRPETLVRQVAVNRELLARVQSAAEVEDATLAANHPMQPGFTNSFVITGREAESGAFPEIRTRFVSPTYQRTLGVPLLAGRELSESDDFDAPSVGVLNRAAAERYFPDADPVGQEISFWGIPWRVVGVMGDERFLGLDRESEPAIYVSLQQLPQGSGSLLVRTTGDVDQTVRAMRAAIRSFDPQIALYGIETLDETVAASIGRPRFTTTLIGMFATLAIVIALVGLHGLLSYMVAQRESEMGIRLALGATEADISRLVLGEGVRLAAFGIAIGALLAFLGSRLLDSLIFGVSAVDPLTYVAVGLVALLAALLASWLPARRAVQSDPLRLLRAD